MVYSVQYLRGLAAIMVLVQHVAVKGSQYAGNPMPWYHIGGPAGVELFFVISGFIMCFATAEKSRSSGYIKRFLANRFSRILPLYWSLTLLGTIIFLILPDKVNIGGGETKILESFLLIPTSGVYIIKNGWTLCYEFFFYFIFSIGMLFPKWLGHIITSLILIALISLHFMIKPNNVIFSFATDPILFDFILGILVFEFYIRFKKVPLLLSIVLLLIGFAFLISLNNGIGLNLPISNLGLACFFLCLGLVFMEETIKNNEIPLFTLFGDSSYSLYLFHPFVLAGGALLLSRFCLIQGLWVWPFLVISAGIALAGGIFCYYYLEKPITSNVRSLIVKIID